MSTRLINPDYCTELRRLHHSLPTIVQERILKATRRRLEVIRDYVRQQKQELSDPNHKDRLFFRSENENCPIVDTVLAVTLQTLDEFIDGVQYEGSLDIVSILSTRDWVNLSGFILEQIRNDDLVHFSYVYPNQKSPPSWVHADVLTRKGIWDELDERDYNVSSHLYHFIEDLTGVSIQPEQDDETRSHTCKWGFYVNHPISAMMRDVEF